MIVVVFVAGLQEAVPQESGGDHGGGPAAAGG